jgi:hypothetical protein
VKIEENRERAERREKRRAMMLMYLDEVSESVSFELV